MGTCRRIAVSRCVQALSKPDVGHLFIQLGVLLTLAQGRSFPMILGNSDLVLSRLWMEQETSDTIRIFSKTQVSEPGFQARELRHMSNPHSKKPEFVLSNDF